MYTEYPSRPILKIKLGLRLAPLAECLLSYMKLGSIPQHVRGGGRGVGLGPLPKVETAGTNS